MIWPCKQAHLSSEAVECGQAECYEMSFPVPQLSGKSCGGVIRHGVTNSHLQDVL